MRRRSSSPSKAGSKQASASRWSTPAPCSTSTGRPAPCCTKCMSPARGTAVVESASVLRLAHLEVAVGIPLADDLVVELADRGPRHRLDEGPGVGQLPLGDRLR